MRRAYMLNNLDDFFSFALVAFLVVTALGVKIPWLRMLNPLNILKTLVGLIVKLITLLFGSVAMPVKVIAWVVVAVLAFQCIPNVLSIVNTVPVLTTGVASLLIFAFISKTMKANEEKEKKGKK